MLRKRRFDFITIYADAQRRNGDYSDAKKNTAKNTCENGQGAYIFICAHEKTSVKGRSGKKLEKP